MVEFTCSPAHLVRSCGGCLATLLLMTSAASLTLFTLGSVWLSYTLIRLAEGTDLIDLVVCCPVGRQEHFARR